ncbi:MAG: GumC domain-containing protein [Planctomycetota bacterium]|jgi:uncharacterized protein involved in exopolysaccharide biosynthesis
MGVISNSKGRRGTILRGLGVFLLSFVFISLVWLSAVVYLGMATYPASARDKWYVPKRVYEVEGAIRVAPVSEIVLRSAGDRGGVTEYQSFMNTQAELVTSTRVVQRVADDLAGENLAFFEDYGAGLLAQSRRKAEEGAVMDGPAEVLKEAIRKGVIEASAVDNTELIKVTMRSTNPEEARQIVDSFISSYMAVEVAADAMRDDQKLSVLENESKILSMKLKNSREKIRQLLQEYGTATLSERQEVMLKRVTALQGELTRIEASRIKFEGEVQSLEKGRDESLVRGAQEVQGEREDYINSDALVGALARRIADIEVDFVVAAAAESAENPAVKQKAKVLDALKSRLQKLKEEVGKAFDEMATKREAEALAQNLAKAKVELEQIRAHKKLLRDMLASEDRKAIEFGRKELDIRELQDQLALDKEIYDRVCRRIKDLEMERKRPERVSVAYYAEVMSVQSLGGIRFKSVIAVLLGALICSTVLAVIAGRSGRKSRTPAKSKGGEVT